MFRKIFGKPKTAMPPTNLAVGEVQGEHIGCYLLWFTQKNDSEPSYQSLATSLEGLRNDYTSFFSAIVEKKQEMLAQMPERRPASETYKPPEGGLVIPTNDLIRNGHEHDLKLATNCLKHIDWIERQLASDGKSPFIEIGGMQIWIGTGVRERQKRNGRYLE